jgi:hypothetical protein
LDVCWVRGNELSSVIRYQDAKGAEQLRAEIALFECAMDCYATVLAAMARLDIDERPAGIRSRPPTCLSGPST